MGKTAILGMRERGGKTKAMPVDRTDGETLGEEISKNVEKGSIVFTDESKAYNSLINKDFEHGTVNHSVKEYVKGMVSTNGIESVWAVIKRGYNGVYHNWSKKHIRRYVDEFSFRLNEGNCAVDTENRLASLFARMVGKRITYKELVA